MNITFHAADRYNFNRNDADIQTGIPDSVNGKLEEAGLRHPFTRRGEMRREVSWTTGQAGTTTSSVKPPEGR